MENVAPPFFASAASGRLQNALSTLLGSLATENNRSLAALAKPKIRYVQTHGARAPVVCQCLEEWPNELSSNVGKGLVVICQLNYRGWLSHHQLLAGFVRKGDGSNQKLERKQLQQLSDFINQKPSQVH